MYLSDFWSTHGNDIIISSVFILASIFLLVTLIINLGKSNKSKKLVLISSLVFAFVLIAVNYILIRDYNIEVTKKPNVEILFPIAKVLLFNAFIIIAFVMFGYLFIFKREKTAEKISVSTVANLSLFVVLASVLMLFGIPILPSYAFLKVEVSALIYFMVFLWFGIKPTIVVILLTNLIHVIMPSISGPVVFGLDESANVVACLVFLTPSFIAFRKLPNNQPPELKHVIITSILGVLGTVIFMVLYNNFIFIPIYERILEVSMGFDFLKILVIFGPFNLIKWSVVSIVVILLYQRLYYLKAQLVKE